MTTVLTVLAIQAIASVIALVVALVTENHRKLQLLAVIVLLLPMFMFGELARWADARKEA